MRTRSNEKATTPPAGNGPKKASQKEAGEQEQQRKKFGAKQPRQIVLKETKNDTPSFPRWLLALKVTA